MDLNQWLVSWSKVIACREVHPTISAGWVAIAVVLIVVNVAIAVGRFGWGSATVELDWFAVIVGAVVITAFTVTFEACCISLVVIDPNIVTELTAIVIRNSVVDWYIVCQVVASAATIVRWHKGRWDSCS